MILILLLTVCVLAIPVLHLFNAAYVRRLALMISAGHLVMLVLTGAVDAQLSALVDAWFDQTASSAFSTILFNIRFLLF